MELNPDVLYRNCHRLVSGSCSKIQRTGNDGEDRSSPVFRRNGRGRRGVADVRLATEWTGRAESSFCGLDGAEVPRLRREQAKKFCGNQIFMYLCNPKSMLENR